MADPIVIGVQPPASSPSPGGGGTQTTTQAPSTPCPNPGVPVGPGSQGYQLSDMISRVRSIMRDDAGIFITNQDITAWLNEGLLDLAWRTRSVQLYICGTIPAGTWQVTLPPRFQEVSLMRTQLSAQTDPSQPFQPVTFVDDDAWENWQVQQGSPPNVIARIFGPNIEIYPAPLLPTVYDLKYVGQPLALAGPGDQTDLPQELQLKVIRYAMAMGMLKSQQYIAYEMAMQEYNEGLAPVNPQARTMPGPLQIALVAGPFDTPDATHI